MVHEQGDLFECLQVHLTDFLLQVEAGQLGCIFLDGIELLIFEEQIGSRDVVENFRGRIRDQAQILLDLPQNLLEFLGILELNFDLR